MNTSVYPRTCLFQLQVKVMMRIFSPPNTGSHGEHGSLILSVDARKKQVTLHDPSASGYVSATRRTGIVAPKTFAFDAVFPQDDSLVSFFLYLVQKYLCLSFKK